MIRRLFLAAATLLAVTAAAAAQTPEEAVAYAFLGLADGASIERSGTTMTWVETGSSPAAFDGDAMIGGQKAAIRFIVKAVEECRFEITLEGPSNLVPGGNRLFGRIDLKNVGDITIAEDGFKTSIEGIGFCQTGQRNPTCMTIHDADLFGSLDAERHSEAVAFLREQGCAAIN
ncbi:hypothetical protein [Bauldia litoralis]|uniref:Uncharacterized protein n=1 Tax=Bauldia litoralis TaxID=665467 RepID=A0A1G6DH09_9HYPH|nr:hypothetical protein [Bauldia litoralis]SDB44406.1 hypothetical protein SAMN02982931_03382 [Bauldia litoralis]